MFVLYTLSVVYFTAELNVMNAVVLLFTCVSRPVLYIHQFLLSWLILKVHLT